MSERINARLSRPFAEFVERMVGETGLYENPSDMCDLIRRDMERRDSLCRMPSHWLPRSGSRSCLCVQRRLQTDMTQLERKEAEGW